ncbi:UDP-N-acetylmuramoyl-L-alanyl-D-glutamate--2,6-diaminopimelate ligase [Gammaproteobacteria bacterium 53_120_T64]|nr:UDP-N-acetylmuramoyl-L-alanyl-D-glutamate--2,6-diaminopimelate ligase [Gammaproteobacteria bacterium 53_120_T64]
MTLGELVADVDVNVPDASPTVAWSSLIVAGLQLDSRKLAAGEVFIAYPGLLSDGRDYLAAAQAAGAVAALVESEGFNASRVSSSLPIIAIDNLAHKVSAIAGRFYGVPSANLALIGITGTNGKTTCAQLLAQLFALLGQTAGVIGTLGYGLLGAGETGQIATTDTGLTTPDAVSVQRILAGLRAEGAAAVAMEVSSHSLDQGRVGALQFSTGVFTNLTQDHLDYHQTMAAYQQAKARLFHTPGLENAIVNSDDAAGRAIIAELTAAGGPPCYSYSCSQTAADIYARAPVFGPSGICADLTTPWGEGELRSCLQGEFNLSNLLAVVGAACAQGHALPAVLAAVEQLQPVPGRLEVVEASVLPLVVVDYAHTPDALEKALSALRPSCSARLWCVFGCGGDRDQGKRAVMGRVAATLADQLVITSDNPRGEAEQAIIDDVLAGVAAANKGVEPQVYVDRRAAIRFAVSHAGAQDVVLIAGKGHEDYQQIKDQRLPFNDVAEVRLALRARGDA